MSPSQHPRPRRSAPTLGTNVVNASLNSITPVGGLPTTAGRIKCEMLDFSGNVTFEPSTIDGVLYRYNGEAYIRTDNILYIRCGNTTHNFTNDTLLVNGNLSVRSFGTIQNIYYWNISGVGFNVNSGSGGYIAFTIPNRSSYPSGTRYQITISCQARISGSRQDSYIFSLASSGANNSDGEMTSCSFNINANALETRENNGARTLNTFPLQWTGELNQDTLYFKCRQGSQDPNDNVNIDNGTITVLVMNSAAYQGVLTTISGNY
jgi:hypothetical protein